MGKVITNSPLAKIKSGLDVAFNSIFSSNRLLFLGDLSFFATELDIAPLLSNYGTIKSLEVKRGKTGDSLMHGFVEYESEAFAQAALYELNGFRFMGRTLRVNWTNQKVQSAKDVSDWVQVHVNFRTPYLDAKISEEFMESVFMPYGKIGDITVKRHYLSQNPPLVIGYAFVYFLDAYAALRCVHAMRDIDVDGIRFECCLSYKTQSALKAKSQTQQKADQPQQLSPPIGNQGISPTSSAYTNEHSTVSLHSLMHQQQQAFALPPARQQQGRGSMMRAQQQEISYEDRYRAAYPQHRERQPYREQQRQPQDYEAAYSHQGTSPTFMQQYQDHCGNSVNVPQPATRKPKFISEVAYHAREPMYHPSSYDMNPRHFESATATAGMANMSHRGNASSYMPTRGHQQQPEPVYRNEFAYEAQFSQGDDHRSRNDRLRRQEHDDYHTATVHSSESYLFKGPRLSPVLDGLYSLSNERHSSGNSAVVTPPESFSDPRTRLSKESLSHFGSDIWSDSSASASSVGIVSSTAMASLLLGERTDSFFSFAASSTALGATTEDALYLVEEPNIAWSALSSFAPERK